MYMPPEAAATMAETVDNLQGRLPSDCGGFQHRLKDWLSCVPLPTIDHHIPCCLHVVDGAFCWTAPKTIYLAEAKH